MGRRALASASRAAASEYSSANSAVLARVNSQVPGCAGKVGPVRVNEVVAALQPEARTQPKTAATVREGRARFMPRLYHAPGRRWQLETATAVLGPA